MKKYVECFDDRCQCTNCENEAKENSILQLCKDCLELPVETLIKKEKSI